MFGVDYANTVDVEYISANTADPNQTPQNAASDGVWHCLHKIRNNLHKSKANIHQSPLKW